MMEKWRRRMCKEGLLASSARALEKGECHRGIGGEHRKYVPDCVRNSKDAESAAARNRKRLASVTDSPSAKKKFKEQEKAVKKMQADEMRARREWLNFKAVEQAKKARQDKESGKALYTY